MVWRWRRSVVPSVSIAYSSSAFSLEEGVRKFDISNYESGRYGHTMRGYRKQWTQRFVWCSPNAYGLEVARDWHHPIFDPRVAVRPRQFHQRSDHTPQRAGRRIGHYSNVRTTGSFTLRPSSTVGKTAPLIINGLQRRQNLLALHFRFLDSIHSFSRRVGGRATPAARHALWASPMTWLRNTKRLP